MGYHKENPSFFYWAIHNHDRHHSYMRWASLKGRKSYCNDCSFENSRKQQVNTGIHTLIGIDFSLKEIRDPVSYQALFGICGGWCAFMGSSSIHISSLLGKLSILCAGCSERRLRWGRCSGINF